VALTAVPTAVLPVARTVARTAVPTQAHDPGSSATQG
jgi:hypothetical protein